MKIVFCLLFLFLFFSCKNDLNNTAKEIIIKNDSKKNETIKHINENNKNIKKNGSLDLHKKIPPYKKKCNTYKIDAYFNGIDNPVFYIFDSPNGDTIKQLFINDVDFEYLLSVTDSKKGWFKIEGEINGIENNFKLPNNQAWVRGSVLSKDNFNSITVLDHPENGRFVGTIPKSHKKIKLLDMCGPWVKVEYDEIRGWVKDKFLCGNPLTSCC